jgi:ER lumen protein retaining receptor
MAGMAELAAAAADVLAASTTLPPYFPNVVRDAAVHASHMAQLTRHSWNIFRYIGDYLHLGGVIMLMFTLWKNRSCQGISRSTQLLYLIVFCTRYLDLLDRSQTPYLVFFKVTYIATSLISLFAFWKLDKTYEHLKDTCNLAVIFVPCIAATMLYADDYAILDVLWTFSQFLEGFAMVPQYIFCYRDPTNKDFGVRLYVLMMGGYRVFYAANWIYKKIQMPNYSDVHSWVGGTIKIAFFVDYILSQTTGFSLLRAMVLKVDENINDISNSIEVKVLGPSRARRSAGKAEAEGCELRARRSGAHEAMDV